MILDWVVMYAAASLTELIIVGSVSLLYIGDFTPLPTYAMLMSNTKVVLHSKTKVSITLSHLRIFQSLN